ncbi:hypothetical protein [Acinetobacter pittii]|jgi:hypothetical protein|uniref:hypothetical protein n=1 Tax=Acinetobacter pittii TaxID=48296 RepID=UPI001F05DBD3|nr:hypothetical protein [Acinetobacter pittii]MCH2020196.1 hypothetical protein [Acinetobacter pittii]
MSIYDFLSKLFEMLVSMSDKELNRLSALQEISDKHLKFYPVHDVDVHHRPDIFIGENTDALNGF